MLRHNLTWRGHGGNTAASGQPMFGGRLTMLWLLGMMVLLPMELIKLPLNIALVDCWVLMALPLFWWSFVRGRHVISWAYTVPMWLILVASFASTFAAPDPSNSLMVVVKEIYAYIWFVTLATVLGRLDASDLRRVLVIWAGAVFMNGFLVVGQFLSPEIWRFTTGITGHSTNAALYRPTGLFVNANAAALFQLLGFVPVVLASPSQKIGTIAGGVVFLTMLATGSMGATVAFIAGFMVAIAAIFLRGRLAVIHRMLVQLAVVALLLGGLAALVISHNERYQAHIQRILIGRSERSSEGRFDLWRRGFDAFLENDVLLWGVGPENFREVDSKMTDNQLHNDFLAFSVERGLLGSLGLALFASIAAGRAAFLLLINSSKPGQARLASVVFLSAMVATMVESLTHQVFHFRELWLVLALQEAMLLRATPGSGIEPIPRAPDGSPHRRRGFVVQRI